MVTVDAITGSGVIAAVSGAGAGSGSASGTASASVEVSIFTGEPWAGSASDTAGDGGTGLADGLAEVSSDSAA